MEKRKVVIISIISSVLLLAVIFITVLTIKNRNVQILQDDLAAKEQIKQQQKVASDEADSKINEAQVQEQLMQLEALRIQQDTSQQVDEQKVQDQLKQLDSLRKDNKVQVLTEQQVQDQLKQLEALRKSEK